MGGFGDATATSFFPSKPLGCYGDGGAILTNDYERAARLRSLRVHGCPRLEDDCVKPGINGRMDTLQAAILLEKLDVFEQEMEARQRIAQRYQESLQDCVQIPQIAPEVTSVWAAYTVSHPERDRLARELDAAAIPTRIYYPRALHQYTAYRERVLIGADLSVSEVACRRVLSLPMHPYLTAARQERVIDTVRAAAEE